MLGIRDSGDRYAVVLKVAAASGLATALFGCGVGPLAKHTTAFAAATNVLVENSTNAYRAAERLHDDAEGFQAVAHFDGPAPYNPYAGTPLITDKGLTVRVAVLEGVRTYAATLAELTHHVKSDALDTAAGAVGKNLKDLSATLAADVAGSAGSTGNKLVLSNTEANAVSTAAEALGTFLMARKSRREVGHELRVMQPTIDSLCTLLERDMTVLRNQSELDYRTLVEDQDGFIRHTPSLNPIERREQILLLPRLVRSQRATDALFVQLQSTIAKFRLTHAALAADAGAKHAESLRARLDDLTAAGEALGRFYQSLPTH